MPEAFQYLFEASLILSGFFVFYRLLLEDRVNWRIARSVLIAFPLLAFGIPLLNFEGAEILPSQWLQETVLTGNTEPAETASTPLPWLEILAIVFWVGMLFRLGKYLAGLWMIRQLQGGNAQSVGQLLVFSSEKIPAPFSFFNRVYLPSRLGYEEKKVILSHEEGHYRARHAWDLLYYECILLFQWFNPAARALSNCLKQVHEYEADSRTLNQGISLKDYQQLIYKHIVMGAPFLPVNHFSKNSVKRRIIMMNSSKPKQKSGLRLLAGLPLLALSLILFSFTSSATGGDLDKWPQYPGGQEHMKEFIWKNFKYPKEAEAAGIEGKVIVSFTVETNGALKNIEVVKSVGHGCDEVATNIVQNMPHWEPGIKDGKKVAVKMTLPFMFALKKDK